MWQGSMYVVGGQAYGIDRDIWQGWEHVVGSGCMWQGVGVCGRGGGRMWDHVAGVGYVVGGRASAWMGTCGRGGDMW